MDQRTSNWKKERPSVVVHLSTLSSFTLFYILNWGLKVILTLRGSFMPPPHSPSRARICKHLWSPGIDSASICSLAGRYDKQDCCTVPVPGLLKRPTNTLQRQFRLYIPFLGIARPQPQFLHSCVCERFIYSQDRSTYFLQQKRQLHRANI